jgi:hypothetical protein
VPRGLTRRFPTLLAAAALTALAAAGCADEAAAAHVGDQTLSDTDLMDEVTAIYDNSALWDLIDEQNQQEPGTSRQSLEGDAPGSFTQQFVGGVLQQRVTFMLVDELHDQEGTEVTEVHRSQAEEEQTRQYGAAFEEFPERYRDQLVEDYSRLISLQEEMGEDGFNEAITKLIDETDVEINSRYGTWDADVFASAPDQLAVVPPVGPTPAEGDEAPVDLGAGG